MSEAIKFIDFGDAKLPIAAKPHYIIEAEKNSADLIQILNPKKKTKRATIFDQIKNLFKGNRMKLVNTTQKDYELFQRLAANKNRATLETRVTDNLGLTGKGVKTNQLLSFVVGKYKNIDHNKFSGVEQKPVFMDNASKYEIDHPVEVCKVIKITSARKETIELRWLIDPQKIRNEWDEDFDLDSAPATQELTACKKKTPWEARGLTQAEFNKKKSMARLEDIQEEHPESFAALLTLVENGKVDKLVKLADTL